MKIETSKVNISTTVIVNQTPVTPNQLDINKRTGTMSSIPLNSEIMRDARGRPTADMK